MQGIILYGEQESEEIAFGSVIRRVPVFNRYERTDPNDPGAIETVHKNVGCLERLETEHNKGLWGMSGELLKFFGFDTHASPCFVSDFEAQFCLEVMFKGYKARHELQDLVDLVSSGERVGLYTIIETKLKRLAEDRDGL